MKLKFKMLFIELWVTFAVIHEIDSSQCSDKNELCPHWKDYCKSKLHPLTEKICPLSCGVCKVTCDASSCKNGGECSTTINGLVCKCALGFAGKTCEKVDACADQPCQNGGICENHRNSFKCKCVKGYKGKWCHKQTKKSRLIGSLKQAKQCKDKRPECQRWRKAGHCREGDLFHNSMNDFCPKSCGICKDIVQCGRGPKKTIGGRVVSGKKAAPNSWPWQALLTISGGKRKKFCGGTLIHEKWILTAAHCLKNITANQIEVMLGAHWSMRRGRTEQFRKVVKMKKHYNFNPDPALKDSDIALLELNHEAKLNKYVRIACLPTAPPKPEDSLCYITGFGGTKTFKYDQPPSETLQEASLSLQTNEQCAIIERRYNITENMLCAGTAFDTRVAKSGCKGDSGGPLVCIQDDVWYLQGVVSFGSDTCVAFEAYTVFARVTQFLDWIQDIIQS